MNYFKIFLNKKFINVGIVAIILSVPVKTFANQFDYEILEKNAKNELNLIKIGKNSQAIKIIETKILKNSNDPYLYYLLGRAYKNLNQLGISEDYFKKAISIDANNPKIFLSYGLLKGKKGELEDSIKLFNKAIELNPNYTQAYSNRGVAKGAISDNLGAIEDFNTAIKINPYLSDPYRNRGITNELIGNILGACKDWKTAISLGQNQPREWYKDQCNNIVDLKDLDKKNIISSLEETNKRLKIEIEALKNSSRPLETISIGDTSSLINQETKSENNINKLKKNKLEKNLESNQDYLKLNALKTNDTLNSINNFSTNNNLDQNYKADVSSKLNTIEKINKNNENPSKHLLVNNLVNPISAKNPLYFNDYFINNRLTDNFLNDTNPKQNINDFSINNNILYLIIFILGATTTALVLNLFYKYKISLKKINDDPKEKDINVKEEEINFSLNNKESLKLKKIIDENISELNSLLIKKEIIERKIQSVKYDINYFNVKQSNLNVYTLSKYRKLFSIDDSKIKFNNFINESDSLNFNFDNNYSSISQNNPYSFIN